MTDIDATPTWTEKPDDPTTWSGGEVGVRRAKSGHLYFASTGCALPGHTINKHGAMGYSAPTESVRLSHRLAFGAPLTRFVPVTLRRHESHMAAEPRLTNTSGDFHTLAGTTGFVELPADQSEFPAGYTAPLWRW